MEIRGTAELTSLDFNEIWSSRRVNARQRNESIENTQFPGPASKSNYNIMAELQRFVAFVLSHGSDVCTATHTYAGQRYIESGWKY